MTSDASVGGNGRLRLFCALRLPDRVLDSVVRWQQDLAGTVRWQQDLAGTVRWQQDLAGTVRWQQDLALPGRAVPRENLHLTLAFLGSTPSYTVPHIVDELRQASAAAGPISFKVSGYREGQRVGMLVLDDAGGEAGRLAVDLHERLRQLGVYEPEKRPWLPHLSVIRFSTRPRLHPSLPGLGRVSPSDAALYNSLLRSTGAQYVVLATLALGGS